MLAMLVLSIVSLNCPQNLGQSMYVPSNLVMTNFGSLAWIPMLDSLTEVELLPAGASCLGDVVCFRRLKLHLKLHPCLV